MLAACFSSIHYAKQQHQIVLQTSVVRDVNSAKLVQSALQMVTVPTVCVLVVFAQSQPSNATAIALGMANAIFSIPRRTY